MISASPGAYIQRTQITNPDNSWGLQVRTERYSRPTSSPQLLNRNLPLLELLDILDEVVWRGSLRYAEGNSPLVRPD